MSLVAIGIISRDNHPLAIRTKYEYSPHPDQDVSRHEDQVLKLHYLMNCAIDFVDEKQVMLYFPCPPPVSDHPLIFYLPTEHVHESPGHIFGTPFTNGDVQVVRPANHNKDKDHRRRHDSVRVCDARQRHQTLVKEHP